MRSAGFTVARASGAALARAACLSGPAQAGEGPADSAVITSFTLSDAKDMLTAEEVKIDKVEPTSDGFIVKASQGPNRPVWFTGMNCKGPGEFKTCSEFRVSAGWTLASAKLAEQFAKKLDFNYISVSTDGDYLEIWRMDFISDGVTRKHLRNVVSEFLIMRDQAETIIWPDPKKNPDTQAPR